MNMRRSFLLGSLLLGLIGCGSQAVSTVFPQPTVAPTQIQQIATELPQPTAAPTQIQQVPSDLEITIERTMCFGTCPVYTIAIDHTGKVRYEGKDFVKTVGPAESSISNEQLLSLINAFVNSKYWDYQDSYNPDGPQCEDSATDNPSAATSITINGKTKSVSHYYGCRDFAGEAELIALENLIDQTVNSQQWTE